MFASIATVALASCTSNADLVPGRSDTLAENIKAFGTQSIKVDVNIGSTKGFGVTRGCDVAGNKWDYMPEYPTAEEKAEVMAYIKANSDKNIEVTGWNWTFYYIQHLDGAHHMYSYTDTNGAKHDNIDGTSSMEFLQILENSGNTQHVYNFNAGKCDNGATHNCALMTDGFKGAKTLNEYSSSTIEGWRLYEYKGNYYLGFDFDAKKGDGVIPGDGIYDDWVVKIIPGKGEKDPSPVPTYKPTPDPDPDPTPDPAPTPTPAGLVPEVEVDIHHQAHKDWNEIKTSIHLRDTANVRVFIPVEKELQAMPDDFDIRTGKDYNYIEQETKEVVKVKYLIASKEFEVDVQVNHKSNGIEILIAGADCAEALRFARGIYDDGITFEIHSYLIPTLSYQTIWDDILQRVEIPETSLTRWPVNGSCSTHTYGQIHSAYFEDDMKKFDKKPE